MNCAREAKGAEGMTAGPFKLKLEAPTTGASIGDAAKANTVD